MEYSLQVGTKRQLLGNNGEISPVKAEINKIIISTVRFK